ncbi:TIGR01457 family HAD-type hydrolase [Kroppenstedtia eburnea]|uniref:TIGR01457 family HAD-type hydrolase n=1 Tax=Kroppenstedtia eburnea TaxID=714067 RepID=UPI0036252486
MGYRGYLIDLDGTLFRGDRVISGGLAFVKELERRGLPYLYLTNNSSRLPEQTAQKLRNLGYPAKAEQVVSSAQATAAHLKKELGTPAVMVFGQEGLKHALREAGFPFQEENPEAVVIGIDPEFNYDKMKSAALAIRGGARFYGTNGDRVLPTDEGLVPGNGSLCAAVAAAAGVEPIFIGKPERPILNYGLERLGRPPDETLIVGDNLMTDIQAGINGGMDTLLVFTGVTTAEEYRRSSIRATYTVQDLTEWDFSRGGVG